MTTEADGGQRDAVFRDTHVIGVGAIREVDKARLLTYLAGGRASVVKAS